MADKKKVSVSLDKETYEGLRQLSKLLGVSLPKLLNEASGLLMKRYDKVIHQIKVAEGNQRKGSKTEEQDKDILQAAG